MVKQMRKRLLEVSFSEDCTFTHPLAFNKDYPLGIGGNLSVQRLLMAYAHGIFPWYSEKPILWWNTNPRFVLYPDHLHLSKSLKKSINKVDHVISFNKAFEEVISNCASIPRKGQRGTWITKEMYDAYIDLHREGWAHSTEVWMDGELVGGLYGVLIGSVFYGESMFSKVMDSSKFAFVSTVSMLQENGCTLIDCQQETSLLKSFGAEMINGMDFYSHLQLNRKAVNISFGN